MNESALEITKRHNWLKRYRARIRQLRPEITDEELNEIAGITAHEALSEQYPNDPEKAVDDERLHE